MRFKQYIDFGFIAAYTALFLALARLFAGNGGWARVVGTAAMICAIATAGFDIAENEAILRILDVPLRRTTPAMINAIRGASAAKWALAGITVALLSLYFLRQPKFIARFIGLLLVSSAACIAAGFVDNRFLVYEGYPAAAALIVIAATFFRLR
jgi:hypothetical protein